MVKTDELLTTINMACPCCHQKAEIEFHRELNTLSVPYLKLKKIGGITGKCPACGQTFPYSNPSKLYKYMNKAHIPYQRSYLFNNLVTIAAPIIVLIALIAIISTIAPMVSPMLDNALHSVLAGQENETSPLVLYNFSIDPVNQTSYATFKLDSNSSPVNMTTLNVSIWKNGDLSNTDIWQYSNSSISWSNKNHTGSMLDYDDMAKVKVNLSKYHFNGTDKVTLQYQILNMPAYVHAYAISNLTATHNNTTISVNNKTDTPILSGFVYFNNVTIPGINLTFSGPRTQSIVTDNSGYYSITLASNKTYSVLVDDPVFANIKYNKTSVKIVNNTTFDIRLHT
jgi:hypothetical protein